MVAETEAIARAIHLAGATGCALHVVHVSTGAGVALVAEARARGVDVSCETCPHYLLLTDEDAERLGTVAKCAPPLRPAAEVEALWTALADGSLPMVASDHSPAPPARKAGHALEAWGGIAGAQTTLPLLLGAGRLTPDVLAGVLSAFPARRFRLAGKGGLSVGMDADLVLVRPGVADVLRAEDLRQRHPVSPFLGRRLTHRVERTYLRGVPVHPCGPATGRLVTPAR